MNTETQQNSYQTNGKRNPLTQAILPRPKHGSARAYFSNTTPACYSSYSHVLVWKPKPRQSCIILNDLRNFACLLTSTHLLRIIGTFLKGGKNKNKTHARLLIREQTICDDCFSSSGIHCTFRSPLKDPWRIATRPLAYPFADVARQQERAYDYEKGANQEQHGGEGYGLVRDLRRAFFKLEEREKNRNDEH